MLSNLNQNSPIFWEKVKASDINDFIISKPSKSNKETFIIWEPTNHEKQKALEAFEIKDNSLSIDRIREINDQIDNYTNYFYRKNDGKMSKVENSRS
jgi:hypothetical protein